MSTRCRIFAYYDNELHSIYCHHDGYIEGGVGETLVRYYNDLDKIKELMNLGDISSLGKTTDHDPKDWDINSWHDSDRYNKTVTYNDRGEQTKERVDNIPNFIDIGKILEDIGEEYNYIYFNGDWHNITTEYESGHFAYTIDFEAIQI